ncbi:unnamed protein product [Camellia sinensis]
MNQVIIETDADQIMKLMHEDLGDKTPFKDLVHKAQILLKGYECSVQHVWKDGNLLCADALAKMGANQPEDMLVFNNPPAELRCLLVSDMISFPRDLLYKGYAQQPPVHYHYGYFNWSFDLSCRINDIVELQYLHDYVGITAGAGLTTTPLLNFSGVLGSGFFSIGTDISFDVGARQFAKYNAGLSFNTAILITSLTLNDKGDTLRASCHHTISPLTDTAIAAELTHKFLRNETTLTFGTQHAFFPITLVKARVSSNGRLGALVQQELFPSFLLTVAGDVDVWDVMRSAKLGLSLAFRP